MRRTTSGFTLIECIIATVVVLLGFLGVASVFPASFRGATNDENHTIAVRLAQDILEGVRAHPFGTGTGLDPTTHVPLTIPNPFLLPGEVEGIPSQSATGLKANGFTAAVSFLNNSAIETPAVPGTDLDVATVTVSWVEGTAENGGGVTKTFVMQGGISRVP